MPWTNGRATLHIADARLMPLADESVHCVVTSPPYWGLRDYGLADWEGGDPDCSHAKRLRHVFSDTLVGAQHNNHSNEPWPGGLCGHCGAAKQVLGIGMEPTLAGWIENIVAVGREVRRVLRDDGIWWLNLGDAYAGSWGNYGAREGAQRSRISERWHRPAYEDRAHGYRDRPPQVSGSGLPVKNVMLMPARAAIALQDDGWIVRSPVIWSKLNPMPESTTDRPTSAYELIFMLAKSNDSLFWTHRDGPGTRSHPKPDYRWVDRMTLTEYDEEPVSWNEDMMPCPDCDGAGEVRQEHGQVSMFDGVPAMVSECSGCEATPGEVRRWARMNLWRSHDYYYDADAIATSSAYPNDTRHPKGSEGAWQIDGRPKEQRAHSKKLRDESAVGQTNARNVWAIPTQQYKGAHFATFPEELPRRCILAGTSAHGVCADCGAPWSRAVDVVTGKAKETPKTRAAHHARGGQGVPVGTVGKAGSSRIDAQRHTTGWRPTCECEATTVPATVLDPFVGSGTTLAVAQQLGRYGIGLDLNADYLELAQKRLGETRRNDD